MISEEASGPRGLEWRPTAGDGGKKSNPGEGNGELLATDLNPVEHQFVPETVVTYNPASELRLLSPDGVVKQSPSQRRGHRAQDLYRKQATWTKTGPRLQLSIYFTKFVVGFCFFATSKTMNLQLCDDSE